MAVPEERIGYSSADRAEGELAEEPGASDAPRQRRARDVDLVVLTTGPDRYLGDDDWPAELCAARVLGTRAWGRLTERRLLLEDGLEVEVGLTEPAWAATDPVDPGTRRVVTDGMRILHDPDGRLAALAAAATRDRT
jgi:hypothetical protein